MLCFTALGSSGVCVRGKEKVVKVFPESTKREEGEVLLLSTPEEQPRREVISWPGEYDIEGVAIRGIGHREGQQVSYALEIDGVTCGFLSVPVPPWSQEDLELLGDIDVLAVPPESPKILHELIEKVDPRVLLVPLPPKGSAADILGAYGAQDKEPVTEYKLKPSSLPIEGREVVVLRS